MKRGALKEMVKILEAVFQPGSHPRPPSRNLKEALARLDQETDQIRQQVMDSNSEVLMQMLERIQ